MRIAFAGPRGTGKTTLALHLERHYEFARRSLASPIKQIISELPRDAQERHRYLMEWAEELYPDAPLAIRAKFATQAAALFRQEPDPGRRAQQLGTDIGRALDSQVWIRYFLRHLPAGDVVCDDVRFADEAQALRAAGFVLVRLQASQQVLAERLARRAGERRDPSHPSEHGLDGLPDEWWDAVWDTSEPLDRTLSRLDRLVERLSRRAG